MADDQEEIIELPEFPLEQDSESDSSDSSSDSESDSSDSSSDSESDSSDSDSEADESEEENDQQERNFMQAQQDHIQLMWHLDQLNQQLEQFLQNLVQNRLQRDLALLHQLMPEQPVNNVFQNNPMYRFENQQLLRVDLNDEIPDFNQHPVNPCYCGAHPPGEQHRF